MNILVLTLLVTTYLMQHYLCVNLSTLRLVQVVYRHGERAPVMIYPRDPHKDAVKILFPNGLGELTEQGIDQQYDLGVYIRERYDGFIAKVYNKKEIYVQSSDDDRALMSAQANLAGIFQKLKTTTSGDEKREERIHLQLVPIHSVTRHIDKELKIAAPCPRKNAAIREVELTPEIQTFYNDNREFVEFAYEKSGAKDVPLPGQDMFDRMRTVDRLRIEQNYNLTLPDWATSDVLTKMETIRLFKLTMQQNATVELRRLQGGPLTKKLMSKMLAELDQRRSQPKMFMYSGHDETLSALMSTMGIFNNIWPPTAAMVMVELHKMEASDKLYVEIFYRNTTNHEPYRLYIPGCGDPCYLEEMNNLLTPFIPDNWEAECQLGIDSGQPINDHQINWTYLLYFLIMVFMVAVIWSTVMCLSSKRGYTRISSDLPKRGSYGLTL